MRIDLHVHTVRGSSDSALGLEELIEQARLAGLNGVGITEHNNYWHDPQWDEIAARAGVTIFHGIEVSTDCGHILAYGIEGYVSGIHKAAVLREVADRSGAVLISAHPFRRIFDKGPHIQNLLKLQFPTVKEAAAHPIFQLVDAIEVANGGTLEEENEFAVDVARYLGLPVTGGSDSHSSNSLGHKATLFDHPIRSMGDLTSAIKDSRGRAVDRLLLVGA
ncbi:MAG: PHP domain-containing protein [Dehalococcoidia bacterium]